MAIEIFGYKMEKALPLLGISLWDIFMFVIVLIIGILVVKLVSISLARSMRRAKMDKILMNMVQKVVRILLYIFVMGIALGFLGVNLGAALVSVSVVLGFVLGFALESTLSNIAAGFMISVTKPFKKDDYVRISSEEGYVSEVGIHTTKIDSPDNKHIIIPNKLVWSSNIVNFTRNDTRRVDMVVGVSYKSNLNSVIEVTLNILNRHPKIMSEPSSKVAVRDMADSAIELVVRPWCRTADYWDVFFEIKKSLKEAYDEADIEIPYPQMDLHLIDGENIMKKAK